jgi:flavin-dependent dehydrogenase
MRIRVRLRTEGLSETLTTEVLVLGGGPAGSAAALVLAQGGRAVTLVRPAHPPGASLAQSIPPSARALLGEIGILPAVEAADLVPNRGNTVRWAGGPPRTECFPDGRHGFHAERGTFESLLDTVVRSAGVTVVSGATARRAERIDGTWRIVCLEPSGDEISVEAPWVVDATGRHGFFARRLGREPDRRTTTTALVARVSDTVDSSATDGHTLIESFEDGWAWSVPVTRGVRCVTAMIDPRETPIDVGALGATLADQLRKAPSLGSMAGPYARYADAWACPASLYTCARYTDAGLVVAGDAGTFIDPLSSYGVKKALVSGRLAGIVIATALAEPSMTSEALRYHDAHERAVAREYVTRSVDFFEEAAARYGHRFWSRRLEAARTPVEPAHPPGDRHAPSMATGIVVPVDEVHRAHEALRSAPRLDIRPGSTSRTIPAPALDGRRIVMRDHLVSDAHPDPVRFHHSVDLLRLVDLAPAHRAVPDLWSAYNRAGAPVDLPDLITALAAACAAGFLTTEKA